ncbi:hypothetical protein [Pseudorhodoplanes sp.]|uniref:hypothetical protein n=1 Tax=Pseudorhodoplanes sp. TaxID=1934341 RepID=UPI003D121569
MTVPLHLESRKRFLGVLQRVLQAGCLAWQRNLKKSTSNEGSVLGAELKLPKFLKEQCSDASYKFWKALEKAAQHPDEYALKTRRAFQQFMITIRATDRANAVCFGEAQLNELEYEFEVFWAIEKEWINVFNEAHQSLGHYRKIGGSELLNGAVNGGRADIEALFDAIVANVLDPYESNNYLAALRWSDAFVLGSLKHCEKLGSKSSKHLYMIGEAIFYNTIVRQNLRVPNASRNFDNYLHMQNCADGPEFNAIPLSLSWTVKRLANGGHFRTSSINLQAMWTLLTDYVDERSALVSDGMDGLNSVHHLMLLDELLERRQSYIRNFNYIDRLENMLEDAIRTVRAEAEPEKENKIPSNEACIEISNFIKSPEESILREWKSLEDGKAMDGSLIRSRCANMMAKRWLLQADRDVDKAAEWLAKSAAALHGCENYLGWDDLYAHVHEYWLARGNVVLADRALESRQNLNRAAFGPSVDLPQIEVRRRWLEDVVLPKHNANSVMTNFCAGL